MFVERKWKHIVLNISITFLPFRNCVEFVYYHPQRSWGKVMFLHMSVILFRGVSQHALQVSRPTPRGGGWGVWLVGVPGPHLGGLQAHTQGGLQAHTQGCIPAYTEAHLPPADGYCWGQYASYWNAFLYYQCDSHLALKSQLLVFDQFIVTLRKHLCGTLASE